MDGKMMSIMDRMKNEIGWVIVYYALPFMEKCTCVEMGEMRWS